MNGRSGTKCCRCREAFYLMMGLSAVLMLSFSDVGLAAENEDVQHFKMLSTVEYTGKGQFKSQVETLLTARKESLFDDRVQYFISTNDFDLGEESPSFAQQSLTRGLSFVVDRTTRRLSGASEDLSLLEKVNNRCIGSVKEVTKNNIGKTWKQTFDLSFLGKSFPAELKFTLTAIELETKAFGKVRGKMIAVRALSEPFVFKVTKVKGGAGSVKSRMGAVYLFDSEIEDIYISMSVFEATTNINGFKERLRHEVATYKSDAGGVSVALSNLGKKFEKLVGKLRLAKKTLKVDKETPLPRWARREGLTAAQVANICGAMACEGALNPVAMVCIPVARTVAMQSFGVLRTVGQIAAAGSIGTVGGSLVSSVPAVGGLKIATGPAFLGVGAGTAGAVAGGAVGTVAVAGGFSSDSSSRSPTE